MLVRPSRQGSYRTAVLVIAVVLFVGGLAGLRSVGRPMTAAEIFKSAQDFVAAHPSGHFDGTVAARFPGYDGDSEDTDVLVSSKGRMFGEFHRGKGMHVTSTSDDSGVNETLLIGKVAYWRGAEDTGALVSALWAKEDLAEDEDDAEFGVESLFEGDVLQMLDDASAPRIVERFGETTKIRVEVHPKGAPEGLRAWMEIVVADNGELRLAGTHVRNGKLSADTVLRFDNWGQLVELAAPAADMIDVTPDLNEEAVAAWHDAPLYMPRNLPRGWTLDYAEVLSAEETEEGCEQVEIDFVSPEYYEEEDEEAPYLYLYELPTACAQPFEGVGVQAFQAGPYAGTGYTDRDGYSLAQIRIDDKTTLQADSNIPVGQLQALLADLVPLDFGRVSVAPLEAQSA